MDIRVIVLGAVLLAVHGCGSAWQRTYEGRPATSAVRLAAGEEVVIREVPWSRLEATLSELAASRAASDTHYDDWSAEQKREADRRLLVAMQIPEPLDEVEIVGRSSFKTTDRLRPNDGELERFARQIGATQVAWSRQIVGKADRVVREPVHNSGFRPIEYYDRSDRRYRTRYEYDDWTTYVPVVVEADETAWVVYYLRRDSWGLE
jgi:hypothetical protein